MVSQEWQALIDEKRAQREASIPSQWRIPKHVADRVSPTASVSAFELLEETDILSKEEKEITELHDATSLLELLAAGTVSSLAVTTAFCKRAAVAQQLTNCLTEIFFGEALERARFLDDYLQRTGKPMGPFHGLPISIKDMFMIKGQFASMGYVSYLKKPRAEENSVIVDILLEGGAVLYCKTTVPQGLFIMEGYSQVFGQTMNPHKLTLGPGGSSCGEGALVGLRGSLLGLGSDIGGSIRAPSLCNGVFGIKLSSDRLPYAKQQELFPKGWPAIVCSLGPHAHSARDLTLFCKSVLTAQPWRRDATAYALPWRDLPRKTTLRIGVWSDDPSFPVHPPVSRILAAATEKLRAAGHQLVMIPEAPSLATALLTSVRSFALDKDQAPIKPLRAANEDLHPALAELVAQTFPEGHDPDLAEVVAVNAAREDIREEWAKVWWGNRLDVLICPGSRSTAVPHGKYGPPAWTLVWNLLDFPASIVPYLKADRELDSEAMDGYNPEEVHGAPGSIQIVGWRFQDEEVLQATEIISQALHGQSPTPVKSVLNRL
ncbi:amidase signature domain-containing protein [Aspergillus carlsbadensis]|nr:amidase signature domain-containing protein [Aspergillus carlsbadensis]